MPDGTHDATVSDPAPDDRTVDLTAPRHAASPTDTVTAAVDAVETVPAGVEVTLRTPLDHGHPGQYLFLPLLEAFGTVIELEYDGEREAAHVSTVVRTPWGDR